MKHYPHIDGKNDTEVEREEIEEASPLEEALRQIIDTEPEGSMRVFVAKQALDYGDPESFFSDLAQHGCISGVVSELIYYRDTHAFFDEFYDEIEDIRSEISELGFQLQADRDLKNQLAWVAFEVVAAKMAEEL